MLTALILVCSLATISNDCTRDNALDVVYVPATFESPAACMMRAQAYVANSSIGRDLPQNEAFKVICVRGSINRVDKAESGPGSRARAWHLSASRTTRTSQTSGPISSNSGLMGRRNEARRAGKRRKSKRAAGRVGTVARLTSVLG